VPYTGVPQVQFLDVIKAAFTDKGRFFYQIYFQDVGPAEAELGSDPRAAIRKFYYAISGDAPDGTWPVDKPHGAALLDRLPDPQRFPAWLTKDDEDYFTAEFHRSGFFGPLSRYRNHERDFDWLQGFKDRRIEQPSFFIGGDRDLVLKMIPGVNPVDFMAPHLPGLQGAHMADRAVRPCVVRHARSSSSGRPAVGPGGAAHHDVEGSAPARHPEQPRSGVSKDARPSRAFDSPKGIDSLKRTTITNAPGTRP
jgi:hypothetical protein